MNAPKRRFAGAPEGTAALFFIQIFSTLGFAVLYSTLVLYATKHLQLSVKAATMLMGVFGAFNYGLHFSAGIWAAASCRTAPCLSEAWGYK
jgi:proton-dependent oligopeptide transporter, POT family